MSVFKASVPGTMRRLVTAMGAVAVLVSASSIAAKADYYDGGRGYGWQGPRQEWQAHEWREHAWRDHERRVQEWRARDWAARHPYGYYAPPAYSAYRQPYYDQGYSNYGYAQPQARLSIGIPLD